MENLLEEGGNTAESFLAELVGEDKKYRDPEQLAKGYKHYDALNTDLRRQLDELREELTKQDHAKELLEKLTNKTDSPNVPPVPTDKGDTPPSGGGSEGQAELVRKLMSEIKEEESRKANVAKTVEAMKKAWADKASIEYKNRITAAGLSSDMAEAIASKSPEALLKLIGLAGNKVDTTILPKGDVTINPTLAAASSGDRTWTWYENLRKTNRKLYFDPKTQRQLMKDRAELGTRFGMPAN